jgi:diguanylate cyclase (GGDEF)-like protein
MNNPEHILPPDPSRFNLLPNKEDFFELVKSASLRIPGKFAVAQLDLDSFKSTNDTFGHEEGDNVLVELVNILSDTLRGTDVVVARRSGDEFLIFFNGIDSDEKLEAVYSRIQSTLDDFMLEASIGRSRHVPGQTYRHLIGLCDMKAYEEKERRLDEKYTEEQQLKADEAFEKLEEAGISPRHFESLHRKRTRQTLKSSLENE